MDIGQTNLYEWYIRGLKWPFQSHNDTQDKSLQALWTGFSSWKMKVTYHFEKKVNLKGGGGGVQTFDPN